MSPFAVSKYIEHTIGNVASVKRLRSGSLLVEASNKQQSENALKIDKFGTIPLKSSPHNSLNKKKGVIRCPEFRNMSDDHLKTELSEQGISEVKRLTTFRNGQKETTNTFILTFSTHSLPKTIKAGYLRLPVSLYIPQPLRCFKCQKYGHHKDKCRSVAACQVCSEEGHDTKECSNNPRCRNCEGSHPPNSKKCPTWEKEKQIVKMKTEQNISYPEARRLCESKNTAGPVTYAQAAATAVPSVSKATATTKNIQTQTYLTWPENSNTFKILQTETIATQTDNRKQQEQKPLQVVKNKPGPACSKKSTHHHAPSKTPTKQEIHTQNSDRSRLKTSNQIEPKQRNEEFELEITNRFSDLDDDTGEEEAMDNDPAGSSSSGAVEVAKSIKYQEKRA